MKTNIKKLFVTLILSLSILSFSTWCGPFDDYDNTFDNTIGFPKLGSLRFLTFDSEEPLSLYGNIFDAYESDEEENYSFSGHLNRATQEHNIHYAPVFFQKNISLTENSTRSHSLFKNENWADLIVSTAISGLGLFEVFSFFSR